ncbi:MAG TPA: ElyC/SanA/YdcF family protein [Luteolibacter sp.]|nr:ElyC/SanA/YdcF family protein [Luteolibacter sp.]
MATAALFRKPWLRWPLALMPAIALAILLMIDYSISPLRGFFLHLALGAAAVCAVFIVPKLRPLRLYALDLLLALPVAVLLVIAHANIAATWAARDLTHDDPAAVPATRVGLVFGTTDRIDGRENLYFRHRIDAAEQLWKAGKVETLIVSGDNRSQYYNEPQKMREALVARGIPADRIVRDFAGLRTLDSVVRAKEVFGTDTLLFISQRFQNERAIYLAKAHGIDARGFNARDVRGPAGFKTRLREIGARVKMWLDVRFLDTRPRHLGEMEILPE